MSPPKYFKRESDLVQSFVTRIRDKGLPSETCIICEFESGHGIADVVLFGIRNVPHPTIRQFAKIPPRYAIIFGCGLLPVKFSPLLFSELAGVSVSVAIRVLNKLASEGLLRRLEGGEYKRLEEYINPIEPIVSVEAKLRDWRSALRQAYRYREFSNQSWVLLDANRAAPAIDELHRFVRSGVGLASLNTLGELFIHYEPPAANPLSEARHWAASVQLAKRPFMHL